jgi:hypothetical protein
MAGFMPPVEYLGLSQLKRTIPVGENSEKPTREGKAPRENIDRMFEMLRKERSMFGQSA